MISDGEKIGKAFHRTRQDDHESTLVDLSSSSPGESPASSREGRVDSADRAFSLLHRAGKLEGPFEWPSVRAARLQREAMEENRPPEMASFYWRASDYATSQQEIRAAEDPRMVLTDELPGTVSIMEAISDNDALDGSSTVTWLRCRDLADAHRYISQVGESFEDPGPGEDDGKYTHRVIYVKESSSDIHLVPPHGENY